MQCMPASPLGSTAATAAASAPRAGITGSHSATRQRRSACRAGLRAAVQRVFQEFNDAAVLFLEDALCEPLVKSHLGTPDAAFQELHLPVACHQAMGPFGVAAETQAELLKRSHVVFVVRGSPDSAQLVAQYILEIKGCGSLLPTARNICRVQCGGGGRG